MQLFYGSEQVFHKGELTQLQQSSLECNRPRCRTRKKVGVFFFVQSYLGLEGTEYPGRGLRLL